jgi:hypothetical protein
MKKSSASMFQVLDARRVNLSQTVVVAIALLLPLGIFLTDTMDELVAYLLIAFTSFGPAAVWIRTGGTGLPVMASTSIFYFVYYALPILRKNADLAQYEPYEVLSGAITVSLFLVAASVAWRLVLFGKHHQPRSVAPMLISDSQLTRVIGFGLALGILYFVASGWSGELGSLFGVFRSVSLTLTAVSCFMIGHARAQGSLQGSNWVLALTGLSIIVLLSWTSLFLVTGVFFCIAVLFGYVITCKRIPWAFLLPVAVVVFVLHAGKSEMRHKYWWEGGSSVSLSQAPAIMAEWVAAGFAAMTSSQNYDSAMDRASLLNLLLRVQRLAPDYVPLLDGKSYAVLPEMLVPRFIDPEKISSQTAMRMLNVHFGFQTTEGSETTSIGWGLIAEAYANFGRAGVVGVAVLVGLLVGFFERWSTGAPILSLPGLVAIGGMMNFVNLEGDAAGLMTSLTQSMFAIFIFYYCFLGRLRRKNAHA